MSHSDRQFLVVLSKLWPISASQHKGLCNSTTDCEPTNFSDTFRPKTCLLLNVAPQPVNFMLQNTTVTQIWHKQMLPSLVLSSSPSHQHLRLFPLPHPEAKTIMWCAAQLSQKAGSSHSSPLVETYISRERTFLGFYAQHSCYPCAFAVAFSFIYPSPTPHNIWLVTPCPLLTN